MTKISARSTVISATNLGKVMPIQRNAFGPAIELSEWIVGKPYLGITSRLVVIRKEHISGWRLLPHVDRGGKHCAVSQQLAGYR
jgi:hypothetical protein